MCHKCSIGQFMSRNIEKKNRQANLRIFLLKCSNFCCEFCRSQLLKCLIYAWTKFRIFFPPPSLFHKPNLLFIVRWKKKLCDNSWWVVFWSWRYEIPLFSLPSVVCVQRRPPPSSYHRLIASFAKKILLILPYHNHFRIFVICWGNVKFLSNTL